MLIRCKKAWKLKATHNIKPPHQVFMGGLKNLKSAPDKNNTKKLLRKHPGGKQLPGKYHHWTSRESLDDEPTSCLSIL
jgi:hypothetical protein